MGSLSDRMSDLEDEYYDLCKQYGEKIQRVRSVHHDWLEAKSQGKTNLSYEDFKKQDRIKQIDKEICRLKDRIDDLENEKELL